MLKASQESPNPEYSDSSRKPHGSVRSNKNITIYGRLKRIQSAYSRSAKWRDANCPCPIKSVLYTLETVPCGVSEAFCNFQITKKIRILKNIYSVKKKSKIENFPRSIFQIFSIRLLIDQGQFASRHFADHQCILLRRPYREDFRGYCMAPSYERAQTVMKKRQRWGKYTQ